MESTGTGYASLKRVHTVSPSAEVKEKTIKKHPVGETISLSSPDALEPKPTKLRKVDAILSRTDIDSATGQLVHEWKTLTKDTFFVETEGDFEGVVMLCLKEHLKTPIFLIRRPQDFDGYGLTRSIILPETVEKAANVNESGKDGLIYDPDSPTILLIDSRSMSAANLVELNELLETLPRYCGRPLGPKCKCVVLVSRKMYHEKGSKNSGKVRGDFWRRVCGPVNTWDVPKPNQKMGVCQLDSATAKDLASPSAHTLDFENEPDWRTVLYGIPALDRNGRASYQHSALGNMAAGAIVILKGAPWDNPNFVLALEQLLTHGCYTANGRSFDTSGLVFVRQDNAPGQINKLKESVNWVAEPFIGMFCLNQGNFEECLGDTAIDTGQATYHDMLDDILCSYQGLRISSSLSQDQWIRLLKKIQVSGRRTTIFIDEPNSQPREFQAGQQHQKYIFNSNVVKLYSAGQEQQCVENLKQQLAYDYSQNVLTFSLSPDLELPAITGALHVTSLKKRQFTLKESELLNALISGQPVIIRNLHKNPVLQRQLETLLQAPACLIINGRRRTFLKATVYVVLPENRQFKSPVWNALERTTYDLSFNPSIVLKRYNLPVTLESQCHQLNEFLNAIQTIPPSPRKLWPFPHPTYSLEVLNKVVREAIRLKDLMGSDSLTQEHWHRAIEISVLDDYRGHPEVFSFLMHRLDQCFPADPNSLLACQWVDTSGLQQFLIRHNYQLDRDLVKVHFWELSRHLSPSCLPNASQYRLNEYPDKHLDILCAAVVGASPKNHRTELVKILGVEPQEPEVVRYRHLEALLRRSYNADRWHQHHGAQNNGNQIPSYTNDDYFTMGQRLAEQLRAEESMEESMEESSAPSMGMTFDFFSRLSAKSHNPVFRVYYYLSHNIFDWESWEGCRYQTIADALQTHRLVFLKGEAGTGKSHSAFVVARTLNPDQAPFTVSAGPQSDQEKLFLSQESVPFIQLTSKLKNMMVDKGLTDDDWEVLSVFATDNHESVLSLTENVRSEMQVVLGTALYDRIMKVLMPFCDTRTIGINGPVLQWAKTQSINNRPVVLRIDEANMAMPDFWDIFQGLNSSPPFINYGGEIIYLTDQHKVIMTGNLETAPGRKFSINLRNQATILLLDPMPEAFLEEKVLGARLKTFHAITADQSEQIKTCIMTLWGQYRVLLKDHEFTPRDLNEICDRLKISLDSGSVGVSNFTLKRLVWQTMKDVLAGELPQDDDRLDSLDVWFFSQMEVGGKGKGKEKGEEKEDTIYQLYDQAFDAFYSTLRSSADFTYQGKSTEALARHYWRTLSKIDYEIRNNCVLEGKHALLVQGPPGRGKDELFKRIHAHFVAQPGVAIDQQPLHLNAGCSNWEEMRTAIRAAARAGRILLISELNRIPSHFLEEDLNDLLTGQAAPGFCLVATVNPGDYAGREPFSPALNSRFILQQIGEYSDTELQTIASHTLPYNQPLAEAITNKHCRLRYLANSHDGSGIPPRTSDLLSVLTHIAQYPNLTPDQTDTLCANHYRPLLEMAGVQWADLAYEDESVMETGTSPQLLKPGVSPEAGRKMILQTVYRCFPENRPVYISEGKPENYDPETGQLCLDQPFNTPDAAQRALLVMVKGFWAARKVPDNYPLSREILPAALLINWQRSFARKLLMRCNKEMETAIEDFFPLSSSQKKSLSLPENAQICASIDQLVSQHAYDPSPVLFREFLKALFVSGSGSGISDPVAPRSEASVSALDSVPDSAPGSQSLVPEGAGLVTRVIGNLAATGTGQTGFVQTVFHGQKSRVHRAGVETFSVDSCGNIIVRSNPVGALGYNVIEPQPLTEQTVLKPAQVQGAQTFYLGDGKCHILAGLLNFPQTRLTHLSVTPACPVEVFMDRYTGLYMIRGAKSDNRGGYIVEFILDPESSTFDLENQGLTFTGGFPCHPMIQRVIDQHPEPEITALKDSLSAAGTNKEKVGLIEWFCVSMRDKQSLGKLDGEVLCSQLLTVKPGFPRPKKMAFWMLASWCGLPVRMATSLSGGAGSVEVSENGGLTWNPVFLDGEVDNPDTVQDISPTVPERKKDEPLSIEDLSFYMVSSPEGVAKALTTVKRYQPEYQLIVIQLPDWISDYISLDGPVSVELVKQWLEDYSFDNDPEQVLVLGRLLDQLYRKAKDTPSEELMAIHNSLSYFITVEKKWVPEGFLTNQFHRRLLLQRGRAMGFANANRQKLYYYSSILSRELIPGRDILCQESCKETGRKKLEPTVISAIEPLLRRAASAKLHQFLLGELPGIQYKSIPPGSIKAQRLVQQLPAFKCSRPQPALRQALVTMPVTMNWIIEKSIRDSIKDPDIGKPGSDSRERYERKSYILSKFLAVYAEYFFLLHLYQLGSGETGSLRVLYPSQRERLKDHSLETPYNPAKAGWIKPRNFNEFYQMATTSLSGRLPCDSRLLRESWAAHGFNEANLCLLESDAQQQCLKSWLETIDWLSLVPAIEELPAWKACLQEKTEARSIVGDFVLPSAILIDDIRKPTSMNSRKS